MASFEGATVDVKEALTLCELALDPMDEREERVECSCNPEDALVEIF